MVRRSILIEKPITIFVLLSSDRRKLVAMSYVVIVQCLVVFLFSITVFMCVWIPDQGLFEFDILARMMYLYDSQSCGTPHIAKQTEELVLSNDTKGFNVLPIQRQPVVVTRLTKLAHKTRRYLRVSCGLHGVWLLIAVALRIFCNSDNRKVFKIFLQVFLYSTIFMVIYDISMGVVYIAHIQQSLTKAMVMRYSGWGISHLVSGTDDFAGWLPLVVSVCWMRGIVIMGINIYFCKVANRILVNIMRKEYRSSLSSSNTNLPVPEAKYNQTIGDKALYYRNGENQPYFGPQKKKSEEYLYK